MDPGFHYRGLHCSHAMIKYTHTYRNGEHKTSKTRTGSGGGTKGQSSRNAAPIALNASIYVKLGQSGAYAVNSQLGIYMKRLGGGGDYDCCMLTL